MLLKKYLPPSKAVGSKSGVQRPALLQARYLLISRLVQIYFKNLMPNYLLLLVRTMSI
jgi:hypothetical protein